MTNSRSTTSRSKWLGFATVVAGLVLWVASANAGGRKRIVVLDFDGPKAESFHDDVVRLIKKNHSVIPIDKWNGVAEEMDAGKVTEKNVKKVAKKLKIDGVVTGKIEKRRDEYIVKIQLRAGSSGEVANRVDTKAEGPRLDGKASRDVKDELITAIDELEANHGGGSDEGDDEDKPSKKKKSKASDEGDDEDKADKKKKSRSDDEDEDSPKKGFSKKSSDDEKGSDSVKDKKKAKADEEAEEKAAKKKAKDEEAEEKADKKKKAKDDEDEAKADKKKKAKDDDKKKGDDEDGALSSKKDEDENPLPKKHGGDDEGDDEEGSKKKKKRVAKGDGDDEEGGGSAEADSGDAEVSPTALSPAERAVDALVGMSFVARKLKFTYASDLATPPPGYSQGLPVAGAVIDATVFPLAFGHKRHDIYANIGLNLMYDRVFHINSSKVYTDNMGAQAKADIATRESRFGLAGVFRYPLGPVVVGGKLGYSSQTFSIDQKALPNGDSPDIPGVKYSMVELGGLVRYPVNEKIIVNVDLGLMLIFNAGQIQSANQYGAASATGFEGSFGADYMLKRNIFIRASARIERIGLAFDGSGAQTTMRDSDPEQDVSGATDMYYGGLASIGYLY